MCRPVKGWPLFGLCRGLALGHDVYLRIREVEIDVVGAVELDFHVLRTAAGDDVYGLVDVDRTARRRAVVLGVVPGVIEADLEFAGGGQGYAFANEVCLI